MSSPGPVLGLDYGSRRIGLAISDAEAKIAFPAGVHLRAGLERDLASLRALVEERGVVRIVVGLPIHLNGRAGPEAQAARNFARQLADTTGRPVEMLDERWTTLEAERALGGKPSGRAARRSRAEFSGKPAGRARARRRASGKRGGGGEIDAAAATILLRTYLERERSLAAAAARGTPR
ncbi:MAG: Holliday junction resolvase RuvX [Myxococcota bacterium]